MATQSKKTVPDKSAGKGAAAKPAAAPTDDRQSTFSFGIVFDINGALVPISAADISKIKEQGVKFTLPNPVVLGSMDDLLKFLEDNFGVSLPIDDLPDWLKEIVDKITSMVFTVNVLKLNLAPGGSPDEGVTYALEIAGTFPGESLKPISAFPIGIQGGVFGATNIAEAITS